MSFDPLTSYTTPIAPPLSPQMRRETEVRTYKKTDAYNRDAKKMAEAGWSVADVTSQRPRSGCGRILFLGLFAAVFHPKPEIVVTYTREVEKTTKSGRRR